MATDRHSTYGWDHLRVCGADYRNIHSFTDPVGSSPRVRSGLLADRARVRALGIISACAERTWRMRSVTCLSRDHLRVCGADSSRHSWRMM